MIKKLSSIMLLIFAISLISAITIYSGEPIEIELEKPFEYYSIVGNSTEIILDVTENGNGNNVTIIPDKYSTNDSFEIIFFDINSEVIVNHYSSGSSSGGSRRTVYRDRNITEYVDKEVIVEVPGKTITNEIEKVVRKSPWWAWAILSILMIIVIAYPIYKNYNTNAGGY